MTRRMLPRPTLRFVSIAAMLLMAGSISFGAAPARGAACAYAPAGGKGLQYLINTTSSDVICFRSGT